MGQLGIGHVLATQVQMDEAGEVFQRNQEFIGELLIVLEVGHFKPAIGSAQLQGQAAELLKLGNRFQFRRAARLFWAGPCGGGDQRGQGEANRLVHESVLP